MTPEQREERRGQWIHHPQPSDLDWGLYWVHRVSGYVGLALWRVTVENFILLHTGNEKIVFGLDQVLQCINCDQPTPPRLP